MRKWWPMRWWVWAAVTFALALVAVSLVPYRHAKEGIDHWARGGRADFYTVCLHALLVWAVRVIGVLILTLALALRDRVEVWARAFAADWVALAAEAKRGTAELVRQKTAFWVVGAMTIAGCVLRLTFLFRPMAYDESAAYVTYAVPPLHIGLSNYLHPGNHMLNTVLVHITTRLFGSEPWAIRLPALCAGVLFVPVAYLVVRQLWGAASGVLTAGLVAGAASLVEYSSNGRGYMLGTLWFFTQVGLADYVRRRDNQAAWFLLAVAGVLGLYTVASMLYGLGLVFAWLLLSLDMRTLGHRLARLAATALVVVLLTLALYAPALLVAGIGQMTSQEVLSRWPLGQFSDRFLASAPRVWAFWHRDVPMAVRVLLAGGFLVALLLPGQVLGDRRRLTLAVPLFFFPVLIVHRAVPPARALLFLWPLYLAIAGAGLAYAIRRLALRYAERVTPVLATVLAVTVGSATFGYRSQHENDYGRFHDGKEVALFLRAQLADGDRVVAAAPAFAPLRYYFRKLGIDEEPLTRPWSRSRRLLVVVNCPTDGPPQSVEEVLAVKGVSRQEFGPALEVQRFRHANLYELRRMGTSEGWPPKEWSPSEEDNR